MQWTLLRYLGNPIQTDMIAFRSSLAAKCDASTRHLYHQQNEIDGPTAYLVQTYLGPLDPFHTGIFGMVLLSPICSEMLDLSLGPVGKDAPGPIVCSSSVCEAIHNHGIPGGPHTLHLPPDPIRLHVHLQLHLLISPLGPHSLFIH